LRKLVPSLSHLEKRVSLLSGLHLRGEVAAILTMPPVFVCFQHQQALLTISGS
jgi:hypothetical protein